MLAWGGGLLALGAGWTDELIGASRSAIVVVFSTFLVAGVGALMARDEPPFLEAWLPSGGLGRLAARVWVLAAWVAPCTALGATAAMIRRGPGDAGWLLGVGLGSALLAIPLVMVCGRLRDRAPAVYGPVAAVLAAALATVVGTSV
jgi:hypothetical protein